MSSVWNFERLYSEIIGDREMCVNWCEENGLIPTRCLCKEGHEMNLKTTDNFVGYFICSKKHISGKFIRFSRTRGTVFENRRMPPEKFLCLVHCFANDISYRNGALECSMDGDSTSKSTVAECYNVCRELIAYYYLEVEKDYPPIGGTGKKVEVVELIIETRKFTMKTFGEGTVVVVMIEQDSKKFVLQRLTRKEQTLGDLVKENVLKGSIIIPHSQSDSSFLSNAEYPILYTEDPKMKIFEKFCRGGLDKLLEHLFKANMRLQNKDIFEKLISVIHHAYPL